MRSPIRRKSVRFAAFCALLSLALVPAAPASASPETLKRSVSNILFGPLDMGLSPVVSARSIYIGLRDIDDTLAVRLIYPLPGFAWNTGVGFFGGAVRIVAGFLEFLPGVGLYFFEADLDPIYEVPERGEALVENDTVVLNVKFGIDYMHPPF
ncbi:MAG: hypothetical protein V3U03_11810 [Myxococcota bacterium]